MREPPWRARRTVDLLVAGAFGALAVAQTWVEARAGTSAPRVALVAAANLVAAGLLLRRRRIPVTVVLGTAGCAAVVTWAAAHPAGGPLAPAVALYTLAAQAGWRWALSADGAALALLAAADAVRGGPVAGEVAQAMVVLAVATLVGLYAGGRAQVAAAHAARAEQMEREQALRAREAVQAERMWIARELHDSIGHHVSLLVVQAGAVSATVPDDHPARPVLDSMIAGGKEAMTEMRRMVNLLRPVAAGVTSDVVGTTGTGREVDPVVGGTGLPGDPLGPTPGVAEIPALCEHLRRTGLPVEVRMSDGVDVPRTASVAAYRIVQEALTNVVKHAGPVPTVVRVEHNGDILDVRITNAAGRPAEPSHPAMTGGYGHLGMQARVDLFAGRLFAGPVPGGGYAVHATLRLDSRT
ncbi:sensor histidine kinase [Dactylosporangium darangshiense]|uniref:histidine kinase n=1 Tax=Dactylosporangium darangshiense TaxID=579108 RepID=A0ABP8DPZ2_9ACTN